MNTRVTCRAVNPYLDSTIMEDTWVVNLSCKSEKTYYFFATPLIPSFTYLPAFVVLYSMCSYTLISVKNSTLRARYCVLSFSHSPQFVLVKRIGGLPHATGANSIPFYVTSVFAYIASILYKLPSCYNTTANLFTRRRTWRRKSSLICLSLSFILLVFFPPPPLPPFSLSWLIFFLFITFLCRIVCLYFPCYTSVSRMASAFL